VVEDTINGGSREELIEKYSKLADKLGIKDKEDFFESSHR